MDSNRDKIRPFVFMIVQATVCRRRRAALMSHEANRQSRADEMVAVHPKNAPVMCCQTSTVRPCAYPQSLEKCYTELVFCFSCLYFVFVCVYNTTATLKASNCCVRTKRSLVRSPGTWVTCGGQRRSATLSARESCSFCLRCLQALPR